MPQIILRKKKPEHVCSVDKLKALWVVNDRARDQTEVSRANFNCYFACVCGVEYTFEKLVKLLPFKELR